ncbi:MAG: hypothetical protein AAGA96_17315 [Verrucomicrobiota bacterium]
MMKSAWPILIACAFASTLIAEDTTFYLKATDTDSLKAKEGQKVTVYGNTANSGKSASGTNFVNFEGAEFYLVTFKSDLVQFPDGEPSDVLDGKLLAVSGVVSIYQSKPQIKLVSPDQIRLIEEGEEFPPKVASVEKAPEVVVETSESTVESTSEPEEPMRKPPVDPSEYFK